MFDAPLEDDEITRLFDAPLEEDGATSSFDESLDEQVEASLEAHEEEVNESEIFGEEEAPAEIPVPQKKL